MPIVRKILNEVLSPADDNGGDDAAGPSKTTPQSDHNDEGLQDVPLERATGEEGDVEAQDGRGERPQRKMSESAAVDPSKRRQLIGLIIEAIFPFFFYDLLTKQGRQEYVDLLVEDPLGSLLMWVPFILIMALASVNAELAIWLAFSIVSVLILLEFYHHTYKPRFPAFYWLSCGTWVGYLGLGIAYEIKPFNYQLISPVTVSILTGICFVSLVSRVPFTLQMTKTRVPEELAETPWFFRLNMFLTGIWLVLFVIMAISSWISFGVGFTSGSAGEIILGILIPILVPLLGIRVISPMFAERYKKKHPPPQVGGDTSASVQVSSGDEEQR